MTNAEAYAIRLGRLADIHAIQQVFAGAVRELCKGDYDADTIDRWIASRSAASRITHIENKVLWVAEREGEIAGYLVTAPGELIALFVGPAHAGLGIGSALARLGIDVASETGAREVKLESTITAVPFYKKLGFVELARGHYTHGDAALVLPIINMILPKLHGDPAR